MYAYLLYSQVGSAKKDKFSSRFTTNKVNYGTRFNRRRSTLHSKQQVLI